MISSVCSPNSGGGSRAGAGVTLNVFMLEDSPGLIRFIERLARLTSGRVFLMDDRDLGDFVVRDYVSRRSH